MPTDDVTPQDATPPVSKPASDTQSAATNPEDTAAYWRDRYNGQKGYVSNLQRQLEELTGKVDLVTDAKNIFAVEAEGQINTLQSQIAQLSTKLSTLTPEFEQLANQNKQLTREKQVGSLINEKFAPLAGLWSKGLLTDAIGSREGADLETFLDSYAKEISSGVQAKTIAAAQGTTPSVATADRANAGDSLQTISQNLAKLGRDKGFSSPEYTAEYQRYVAAISKTS